MQICLPIGLGCLQKSEKVWWKMDSGESSRYLISVHKHYTSKIPAIIYQNRTIGITSLKFCKWVKTLQKTQQETPYTISGRIIYFERTAKKPLMVRADELLSSDFSNLIAQGLTGNLYNFEYFMNRAYAFNRDKADVESAENPTSA